MKELKSKVINFRATITIYEKIKAFATLNDLTVSEAIYELITTRKAGKIEEAINH
nr:hypothetical protein [Paenisporosarcina sp. TG20]